MATFQLTPYNHGALARRLLAIASTERKRPPLPEAFAKLNRSKRLLPAVAYKEARAISLAPAAPLK